jgi:NDP-sugar pyrophosphorylase family protein
LLVHKEAATTLGSDKKRTIVFENGQHWLENIFYPMEECPASSLNIIGKPLIVYNIEKLLLGHKQIDHIMLPEGFSDTGDIVQNNFPFIQIDEYKSGSILTQDESLMVPLNSVVIKSKPDNHIIRFLVYPWDILQAIHDILDVEVTETIVSKNASVAESSIVKGPCIIEEGAIVDDFTKIIGPTYIAKNSRVGTSSLVRNCMIGKDSSIGFGCEVGRTFLVGKDIISHHNVILDSIIGYDNWFGGFVGTTNVLLNKEIVKYKLGNMLVSTGLTHFGSVIGYNCAIGAGVIILPGRFVPPNSTIQAGTVFSNSTANSSAPKATS